MYKLANGASGFRPATLEGETVVLDREKRPVATIHGATCEEIFKRALLIARTPDLRDAVAASHRVFKLIAADGPDRPAGAPLRPLRRYWIGDGVAPPHGGAS